MPGKGFWGDVLIKTGSTGINSSQHNYSMYELEMTALSFASKKASHYLIGSKFPVQYRTDHSALKGLENIKLDEVKNPRLLRLLEDLLCSDFTVSYVRGVDNCIADYISRLLNSDCEAPDCPRLLHTFKADQELVR